MKEIKAIRIWNGEEWKWIVYQEKSVEHLTEDKFLLKVINPHFNIYVIRSCDLEDCETDYFKLSHCLRVSCNSEAITYFFRIWEKANDLTP